MLRVKTLRKIRGEDVVGRYDDRLELAGIIVLLCGDRNINV
jgi:hypothetical protein